MSTTAPSATGITMEHCLGCGELMHVMGQTVAFHVNDDEETCEGSVLVSEEGWAQALSMANAIRRARGRPPLRHGPAGPEPFA